MKHFSLRRLMLGLLAMVLLAQQAAGIAAVPVQPSKRGTSTSASILNMPQLRDRLNAIVSAQDSKTRIAVYVKSMRDSHVLYGYHTDQWFTPASTMKILTAEAALLFLGPEYRFSTQLLTDAKTIRNGILEGNLYVILSGDPTLTYSDLVDLFLSLRAEQIQAIAGNVYIDNTAYDQNVYGPGWEWKDKGYCYAAPISAGIVNHNCIPFQVAPAKAIGQNAQILTSPQFFYPPIKNAVITKNSARACALHLSMDSSQMLSIDGCVGKNKNAGVSYVVTDVLEYNRDMVKSLLNRTAIKVFGTVTFGAAPQNLSLISQHSSKPLRTLISEMLKKSDNIIAGALFKKLGQLYMHQPGSWKNGGMAVVQILTKHTGANLAGMRILDGSGLSPNNLVTPEQMMQVLNFAYHHEPTSYDFIAALPIAGVDGTLKHRMGNIAYKVRAKTGTISGVIALVGYVVTTDQEPLAFVIMLNGSKGQGWLYKDYEDQIVTALARYEQNDTVSAAR